MLTLRAKHNGYGEVGRARYGEPMADVAYIGPGGREQRSKPLLRTIIGQALRRSRLEQGRTLADVARAARVSMPYLSEVERGRKEASSEVLAAVCDALRIELADMLTEVGRDLSAARNPADAKTLAELRTPSPSMEALRRQRLTARPTQRRTGGSGRPPVRGAGDVVLLAA